MRLYESVFIARPELSPAQVESLGEKLSKVLKDQGSEVFKVEYCGLRQLAYPIKKSHKGHYSIMNIKAEPKAVHELERQMRLNEDVIRFLNISVEAHETGTSLLSQQVRSPRESGFDSNRKRG